MAFEETRGVRKLKAATYHRKTCEYRIRATMAGTFKVAPATIQSMYAPELNAYSAGDALVVKP